MREAGGPDVELMVDCHSFFDVPLAQSVAQRLERWNLAWYEEPVAPQRIEELLEIRRSIRQPMAAGELLFGARGFEPLCRSQAVKVIMPDVKHCGGLLEMTRIAAMARADGVAVAPHNPSGPVSTAANVQIGAGMVNFRLLELQWGETGWRSELIVPEERFERARSKFPNARVLEFVSTTSSPSHILCECAILGAWDDRGLRFWSPSSPVLPRTCRRPSTL